MPSHVDLTPTESAALIILMVEGREMPNTELKERYKVDLSGKSREKLNRAGLVDSWKAGRGYTHRLGDAGWARCKQPLDFAGTRPHAAGAALSALFGAVHRDLERTERSLAMFFAPEPAPAGEGIKVTDRIRTAYRKHAQRSGDWVSIADIRDELATVDRDAVDAALRQLEQEPDVNIVPQANQKALSDRNRTAAVTIGLQPKHFIAIGV